MQRVHIGLGGNLGDPRAAMAMALAMLDGRGDTTLVAVSALYETPPWGKTDQPPFLNACASLDTALEPEALLDACLETERALKRERTERWGPRTLDVDLLDWSGREIATERLHLPHPRASERAFVLVPLADIAPKLVLAGRTVEDWLAATDTAGIRRIAPEGWCSGESRMPG
ncbi:2-amino-4-hydroxy-6-hydroxymethyldihydropteridine diphosphokinase [Consotaella salsifontis]|uniref:2-amino-4-hydroxy-6-hydroxymethyldihydropteridine pyrophosphokinase n=1 Tax=Consotaella salsifontis TaxID=1365950 RepID=A0A1T4P755_9HYPH|nr:2-amino-4-hydroxy-6-hydroxymethyldihydropteridine diphosphokinase [Consotaella salsifontis]SJZ87420.1 2-amino-4-hydroxy-6-hydroxymethyldihydropteridinediphosphokinase [Consotaella salsifontis]